MSMQTGKQSICFETPPYIVSSASIVGKKEGEGPLGACFDLIGEAGHLGRGREYPAERGFRNGSRKSRTEKRRDPLSFFRRSFRTEYCHFVWTHGLPGAALWPVWCVQYLRRGAFPWSNVCCRRICRLRCGDDIEPFCQRRKAVPVST